MATYSVRDIVEKTGARERSVLLWADALALWAEGGTDRAGRGVHRQFAWREIQVAAVLVAVSPFRLPIGVMKAIAGLIRSQLMLPLQTIGEPHPFSDYLPDAFRAAEAGELGVQLMIVPDATNAGDPFTLLFRRRSAGGVDDPPPPNDLPLPVVLTIDLAVCWRHLRP